jgi:hypothetical protein
MCAVTRRTNVHVNGEKTGIKSFERYADLYLAIAATPRLSTSTSAGGRRHRLGLCGQRVVR